MPARFNDKIHVLDVYYQVMTRIIRHEFKDILPEDPDQIFNLDMNIPRHSLYQAVKPDKQDNLLVALLRSMLFFFVLKGGDELRPNLYAVPCEKYQEEVRYAPQVTLYFEEKLSEVEDGYAPITAQISFRIMGESAETYTEFKAKQLANKIKREMIIGNSSFKFKKGRVKATYLDKPKGYWFILAVFNKEEAKDVIRRVLEINNDVPDWSKMSASELEENPPIVPPTSRIYGENRRESRRRPIGNVYFMSAELHLHGLPKAIILVDATGRRRRQLADT